jgi:hypothetical protein
MTCGGLTPLPAIQKAREKAARRGLLCRMIVPKFVVWYREPINPPILTMSLVKHVGFSGDNYLYPPNNFFFTTNTIIAQLVWRILP